MPNPESLYIVPARHCGKTALQLECCKQLLELAKQGLVNLETLSRVRATPGMELFVICDNMREARYVRDLFLEKHDGPAIERRVDEYTMQWGPYLIRFIPVERSEEILRGKRNYTIIYGRQLERMLDNIGKEEENV